MRRLVGILLAGSLVLVTGCSNLEGAATRYRAERMFWQAQREEARLRVGNARPDSITLLKIHDAYSRLRATIRPPFVSGTGDAAKRLRAEIGRQVGMAELTSARLALQARRPDLALEQSHWVASIAVADTGLHREADFMSVAALRSLRKPNEAIAVMYGMLDRYRPIPPPSYDREDAILSVPEAIISLRAEAGDSVAARQDRTRAIEYFRAVLKSGPPPILEAQVRARITRSLIELGRPTEAYTEVSELRRLVSSTPELKSVEPEILYSEARIRTMGRDPKLALDLYDLVVMMYPTSRFASLALVDAGAILEQARDQAGALARYHAAYDRPDPVPDVAPIASFRAAMIQDQRGNWAEAKQLLERILVAYPKSRAAFETPFAIVRHYARAGQTDAMNGALLRAVDIYRGMIAQDTTAAICSAYRWNILRAYAGLKRWNDALATIDEMAVKDRGTLFGAQGLVEGARIAGSLGDPARAKLYVRRLELDYPKAPFGARARETLKEKTGNGGDGKANK